MSRDQRIMAGIGYACAVVCSALGLYAVLAGDNGIAGIAIILSCVLIVIAMWMQGGK